MTTTQNPDTRYTRTSIEADPDVPAVHIWRDFSATPAQLFRAHTDPEVFRAWIGPDSLTTRIEEWDCRTLGSYRYVAARDGEEFAFRGTFPHIADDKIVQTFTWEGAPEAIALETMTFEALADGRGRLHAFSLCGSFEERDAMLASGMQTGINEGYAKLDHLLSDGVLADDAS